LEQEGTEKSPKLLPHHFSASISALSSLDLLPNHIPGSISALSSLDLLLNHIPGSVPVIPKVCWRLCHNVEILFQRLRSAVPAESGIFFRHYGIERYIAFLKVCKSLRTIINLLQLQFFRYFYYFPYVHGLVTFD